MPVAQQAAGGCEKTTIRGGDYSTDAPGLSEKASIDYTGFNSYTSFRCAGDAAAVENASPAENSANQAK